MLLGDPNGNTFCCTCCVLRMFAIHRTLVNFIISVQRKKEKTDTKINILFLLVVICVCWCGSVFGLKGTSKYKRSGNKLELLMNYKDTI